MPDGKAQDMGVEPQDQSGEVELEVTSLAAGGRGVARHAGLVWFLEGVVPGDRVLARARRLHARHVEGRLLALIEPSPRRRAPPCPLAGTCGGCPWMGLGETDQRSFKRRLVQDAIDRIAAVRLEVEEPIPSPEALGYRNRLELTLGRDAQGRPALGLHPVDPEARGLVDVGRCLVQREPANRVLDTLRAHLLGRAEEWIDAAPRGDPFRVLLRASALTGEVLVVVRETVRPFPGITDLVAALARAHPELVGVVRLRARPGRRGGARATAVWGRDWIRERIGSTIFRLPAASFVQANPTAAERLLDLVRELCGPVAGLSLLELYGGVGSFGLELARQGASVTVCEADPAAVRCGEAAAREAGRATVRFVRSDVSRFLSQAPSAGAFDLVLANPPRTGLGRGVAAAIAGLAPRRIVLVSCDPATLARDLRQLSRAGWIPRRAVPVDLFPQTAHIETVVALERGP